MSFPRRNRLGTCAGFPIDLARSLAEDRSCRRPLQCSACARVAASCEQFLGRVCTYRVLCEILILVRAHIGISLWGANGHDPSRMVPRFKKRICLS